MSLSYGDSPIKFTSSLLDGTSGGGATGFDWGGFGSKILDTITGNAGDILGSGAAVLARNEGKSDLGNIATGVQQRSAGLQDTISGSAQFKPFAVTGGSGTASYDPATGMSYAPTNTGMSDSLNQQAGALAQNLNRGLPQGTQQFANMGMAGANQALMQSQMVDPSIAGQRAAMGGLFGQQLGNYGQPQQALQGFTGAALQGAEGMLGGQANTADVDALRQQYAGLASQAAQGLGQGTSQQEIFDQLQGMQAGDRERQALELENRLFAQGRGGVQTAAYGGTPEQLAMAKAQEEARSSNALQAMQMSDAMQNSAQQRALGLSGNVGQLAGTSSGLQGQQISQGSQLAGLGLTGTQAQEAMTGQQLQNLSGLQGQDIGAAQAQQALQAGSLGQAQSLFGMGAGAASLGGQLQGQNLANIAGALGAANIPMEQLLAQTNPALQASQMAQSGRNTEANLLANLGGQEISLLADLGLGQSALDQELIRSLSNIISSGGR